MMDNSLHELALPAVAAQCADQSDRFFRREAFDGRFCYELLRRALAERSAAAWEAIYRQYQPLVSSWVTRHPAFVSSGEEIAHFVNAAFEKFWLAVPPAKFRQFADLAALLRYLQMCVHSVLTDHARQSAHLALCALPDETLVRNSQPDVASSVVDREARAAFWRMLLERVHDERDRQLVYATYVLGLKPREICRQYETLFASVGDVYRAKENLLDRLRRDQEFQKFVADNA